MGYKVEDVSQTLLWGSQLVLDFLQHAPEDVAAATQCGAYRPGIEKDFNVTIITQNIDDLHEGGSSKLHLHGEIFKMRSVDDAHGILHDIRGDINLGDPE